MPAADDQAILEDFAERMGFKDQEADDFVGEGMQRLGYTLKRLFTDPDNTGPSAGTSMFNRSRQAQGGSGAPGGQRRASGGSQYRD